MKKPRKPSAFARIARPEAHQIDTRARKVFEAAVPDAWHVRSMGQDDYGLDYQIEIFEACLLTSLRTAVQLKGAKSAKIVDGAPRYNLSGRHLATYVDAEPLPVFLVLVDLASGTPYYRFVQQYALEQLRGIAWREQSSITIEFDPADRVGDTQRLLAAIRSAHTFMAGLRPAAIPAALAAERDRLESIDPRFSVAITASNGGPQRIHLTPRQPGSFMLGFAAGAADKMRSFYAGEAVRFAPGEVVIDGMPLWERFNRDGGVLSCSNEETCQTTLTFRSSQSDRVCLPNIPSRIVRGVQATRLEVTLGGGLIKLTLRAMHRSPGDTQSEITCNFCVDLGSWIGADVCALAFHDSMAEIGRLITQPLLIDCVVHRTGHNVVVPPLQIPVSAGADDLAAAMVALVKARRIAQLLGRPIVMQRAIEGYDGRQIDKLHQLVSTGEYRGRGDKASISTVLDQARLDRSLLPDKPSDVRIECSGHVERFPILGGVVEYPLREAIITKASVHVRERRRQGDVQVEFRGVAGAEFILLSEAAAAA